MKTFLRDNALQIVVLIAGLIGIGYVMRDKVNALSIESGEYRRDIADLKTFREVQKSENAYVRETLARIDRNVERLVRR